jgi:hypothetical protein
MRNDALSRPGYSSRVRLALAFTVPAFLSLLTVGCSFRAGGEISAGAAARVSVGAPVPAPAPLAAPSADVTVAAPPRDECEPFMHVVALTTTLRASIHREPSSADKAQIWAAQAKELAASARALRLADPDLVIENANLASRMAELAKDLSALAGAEKGRDPTATGTVHSRVLKTSEQVEVITREPAARCAGDTRRLMATPGRLPLSAIQTVIRASFPRYTACYKDGLARNPKLQGRVAIHFVIGRDGRVMEVHDATTEPIPVDAVAPPSAATLAPMPDQKVGECVAKGFRDLVFPQPDGGVVTVVYPVSFSPNQ